MSEGDTSPAVAAVVVRCANTGLFVGWIPGIRGAHTQGATEEELHANLREVLAVVREDDDEADD